jgi:hypothetical protein
MTDITVPFTGITRNRYASATSVSTITVPFTGKADGIYKISLIAPNFFGIATGTGEAWSGEDLTVTLSGQASGSGAGLGLAVIAVPFTGSAAGIGSSYIPSEVVPIFVGNATGVGDGNSVGVLTVPFLGQAKNFATASTYVPKPDFKGVKTNSHFKPVHVNKFKSGDLLRNV